MKLLSGLLLLATLALPSFQLTARGQTADDTSANRFRPKQQ
ncbi:MAG TPA: hypothetical protein VMU57_04645 [Edaphobacter sp.]|nr:hypothetical protein [Edaphobacter sp.]HUZ94181.1 hypothetical protein [Edaphobacter sp.]